MYSACPAHLKSKHGIMRLDDKRKEHEAHVKALNKCLPDYSMSIIASLAGLILCNVFPNVGEIKL